MHNCNFWYVDLELFPRRFAFVVDLAASYVTLVHFVLQVEPSRSVKCELLLDDEMFTHFDYSILLLFECTGAAAAVFTS